MTKPPSKTKSCILSDLKKFAKDISNYLPEQSVTLIKSARSYLHVASTTTGAVARVTKGSKDGKTISLKFFPQLIHKKESE